MLETLKNFLKKVFFTLVIVWITGALVMNGLFAIVGAGERGVIFSRLSGVDPVALPEGVHLKVPFVETVTYIDVRVQKMTNDVDASSKDMQSIKTSVSLNYHVQPDKAALMYQSIGDTTTAEYRVIEPALQETLKGTLALFTAEELITKRSEIKNAAQAQLIKRLAGYHIAVDDLSIVNFKFSEAFDDAIEAKQTAEQLAIKAAKDLDRIKIESEQKLTQARAEAEAQRIQKETISSDILQLRAIEKWDGKLPQYTGANGMPFLKL